MIKLSAFCLLLSLFVAAFSVNDKADAQLVCGDRDIVVKAFERNYGQKVVAIATSEDDTSVTTIMRNKETGSWSIFMDGPSSSLCLVAFGKNWREVGAMDKPA